jgi:PncC family amidohydrolase
VSNLLALQLIKLATARKILITSAESCTGGKLAAAITSIPGASKIFERGLITYANQAKIDLLNVNPATLAIYGAVSSETAKEMAEGALANSQANIAIAITGIAGPESDDTEKPVGLIYLAIQIQGQESKIKQYNLSGNREEIQNMAVTNALTELIKLIKHHFKI